MHSLERARTIGNVAVRTRNSADALAEPTLASRAAPKSGSPATPGLAGAAFRRRLASPLTPYSDASPAHPRVNHLDRPAGGWAAPSSASTVVYCRAVSPAGAVCGVASPGISPAVSEASLCEWADGTPWVLPQPQPQPSRSPRLLAWDATATAHPAAVSAGYQQPEPLGIAGYRSGGADRPSSPLDDLAGITSDDLGGEEEQSTCKAASPAFLPVSSCADSDHDDSGCPFERPPTPQFAFSRGEIPEGGLGEVIQEQRARTGATGVRGPDLLLSARTVIARGQRITAAALSLRRGERALRASRSRSAAVRRRAVKGAAAAAAPAGKEDAPAPESIPADSLGPFAAGGSDIATSAAALAAASAAEAPRGSGECASSAAAANANESTLGAPATPSLVEPPASRAAAAGTCAAAAPGGAAEPQSVQTSMESSAQCGGDDGCSQPTQGDDCRGFCTPQPRARGRPRGSAAAAPCCVQIGPASSSSAPPQTGATTVSSADSSGVCRASRQLARDLRAAEALLVAVATAAAAEGRALETLQVSRATAWLSVACKCAASVPPRNARLAERFENVAGCSLLRPLLRSVPPARPLFASAARAGPLARAGGGLAGRGPQAAVPLLRLRLSLRLRLRLCFRLCVARLGRALLVPQPRGWVRMGRRIGGENGRRRWVGGGLRSTLPPGRGGECCS